MINFDSLTLKAFTLEAESLIASGRVQKVQQPAKNELLVSIRSQGKVFKLYICVDPQYPHLSFMTEKGEKYRELENPQKPPMFCMLLRKYMEGAKIKVVRQPEYERIFEIYFESYNEIGQRVEFVIACEFMGKHSNIILYSYENNVILGSAHNVSSEKSREREVAGGLPYIYPPKLLKSDLNHINEEQFVKMCAVIPGNINQWLSKTFNYVSLALATEVCDYCGIDLSENKVKAISVEKIKKLYTVLYNAVNLNGINPSVSADNKLFSLLGLDSQREWRKIESVNVMIDEYFGYQQYLDKFTRLKKALLSVVNKEYRKQTSSLNLHLKTSESDKKNEKYKQNADLIMANLYQIKSGQEFIELENFYENNVLEKIQIDPSKSPSDNAQRYYKLYNKGKNAIRISMEIAEGIQKEIDYLESTLVSIDYASTLTELKEVQEELIGQNYIKNYKPDLNKKQKSKKEKDLVTIAEFLSSDNYKIFLGKNNKQNDYIISKIASPNDMWLHPQNIPGSHVLIKVPADGTELTDQTLWEAANIAVYFSKARGSVNVPVIYTRRKYLKKPPFAKPGYVTYSNEKTLFVTVDSDLIKKFT